MGKINVGFIGCGRIADLHYLGYKNNRNAALYALCDTDQELLSKRKKQWKAHKTYTDYREMLADQNVHAVEILTPHLLHEQMMIDSACAGKQISLQKPMTLTMSSADRMIAASKENNVLFKVSDNYVWYPPILLAKQMIDNGEIGRPVNLKIKLIVGGGGGWDIPASAWEWRMKDLEHGLGEENYDHGHHLWSTAWFLLGEVERVKAWIDTFDGILDTPSIVMWKYKDEVRYGVCENAAAIQMNIPSKYYANEEWIEITGTRGIIIINRCTGNIRGGPPVNVFNGKRWKSYSPKSDWSEGFIGSTNNFINAVMGKEKPRLSAIQGRDILRFTLAIIKSGMKRREVYLEELDKPIPYLYYWRKKRNEMKRYPLIPKTNSIFSGGTAKYAKQAVELTENLMDRFSPEKVAGWNVVIGLTLQAEGGVPEETFTLKVKDGKAELKRGDLPPDAVMMIRIPAGVWAAILLKKKRLEMAFIQGKLKLEGRAEEGLKLREAFDL